MPVLPQIPKLRFFEDPEIGINIAPCGLESTTCLRLLQDWDKAKRKIKDPDQEAIFNFLIDWFFCAESKGNPLSFLKHVHDNLHKKLVKLTEFLWDREFDIIIDRSVEDPKRKEFEEQRAERLLARA